MKNENAEQPAQQQEPDYKALYEKAAQQYNELAALMEEPAQQEQEPVAKDNSNYRLDPPGLDPRYTSPPAQRTWVGLTEQEAAECWSTSTVRTWQAIEAKLKEKNQ